MQLKDWGDIDLCILGIGKNGHLGLNEPDQIINPYVHKVAIAAVTQKHSMLAAGDTKVSEGYTLGIKDILNARKNLLLITGEGKKQAYENLQKDVISSELPANYLKLHGDTTCIVDEFSVKGGDE